MTSSPRVVALVLLMSSPPASRTTLTAFRRRRIRARDSERALGRTVIAEIPADDDLRLFSEDAVRFYYGDRVGRQGSDRRGRGC